MDRPLHSLLARQLKRWLRAPETISPEYAALVDAVNSAYWQSDEDRRMLERSLELTSQELIERNRQLRGELAERSRTEEELRETNYILRAVVETSPIAIVTLDREGNVRLWNLGAERLFGWSAEEVVGRALPIVPDEERHQFQLMLREELAGMAAAGRELRRRRKDGSFVDVALWTAPIHNAKGQIVGVVRLLEDITARKRTDLEMKEKLKELELLNNVMMGREQRILELKEQVKSLQDQVAGRPAAGERPAQSSGAASQ